jgi:ATP-binding cassette subfamily B protein RaxB
MTLVRDTARANWYYLFLYYGIVLVETALAGIVPIVFGNSIELAFPSGSNHAGTDLTGFRNFILIFLALGVIQLLKQLVEHLFSRAVSNRWIAVAFDKINIIDLRTLSEMGAGNVNQRAVNEIDSKSNYLTSRVSAIGSSILLVCASVFMLFRLLPVFTVALLAMLLVCIPAGFKLMARGKVLMKAISEAWAKFASTSTDFIAAQMLLRSFGAENRMKTVLLTRLKSVLNIAVGSYIKVLVFLLLFMLLIVSLVFTSALVLQKSGMMTGLKPAETFAFFGYLVLLVMRAGSLSGAFGSLQAARAKVERLMEFLALPASHPRETISIDALESFEVRGLSAGFDDSDIFTNVSFYAGKGDIVVLKGPSGCGKSTFIRSLLGMHPISSGKIVINGNEYTSLSEVKDLAVCLPQEIRFFDGPLEWNYNLLSGEQIRAEDLQVLLDQLGLSDRLSASKEGAPQLLQEAGANLSGGEKQRLALAVIKSMRRPLVILDEPTSQVDPVSEEMILREIASLSSEGRIILIATHKETTQRVASTTIDFSCSTRTPESGTLPG